MQSTGNLSRLKEVDWKNSSHASKTRTWDGRFAEEQRPIGHAEISSRFDARVRTMTSSRTVGRERYDTTGSSWETEVAR